MASEDQPDSLMKVPQTKLDVCLLLDLARQVIIMMENDVSAQVTEN